MLSKNNSLSCICISVIFLFNNCIPTPIEKSEPNQNSLAKTITNNTNETIGKDNINTKNQQENIFISKEQAELLLSEIKEKVKTQKKTTEDLTKTIKAQKKILDNLSSCKENEVFTKNETGQWYCLDITSSIEASKSQYEQASKNCTKGQIIRKDSKTQTWVCTSLEEELLKYKSKYETAAKNCKEAQILKKDSTAQEWTCVDLEKEILRQKSQHDETSETCIDGEIIKKDPVTQQWTCVELESEILKEKSKYDIVSETCTEEQIIKKDPITKKWICTNLEIEISEQLNKNQLLSLSCMEGEVIEKNKNNKWECINLLDKITQNNIKYEITQSKRESNSDECPDKGNAIELSIKEKGTSKIQKTTLISCYSKKAVPISGNFNYTYGGIILGKIYIFVAYNHEKGAELWRTDGTTEGTYILKDINPGSKSSNPLIYNESNYLLIDNKYILFSANIDEKNNALWVTDGSKEGTKEFFNPTLVTKKDSLQNNIQHLIQYNNRIYATITNSSKIQILSISKDGSNYTIEDIEKFQNHPETNIEKIAILGDNILLPINYYNQTIKSKLISYNTKTKKTATVLTIKDPKDLVYKDSSGKKIDRKVDVYPRIEQLNAINNKIYFSAYSYENGQELWVYDGKNAKELIDFNPSKELHWSGAIIPKSSYPFGFITYKNKLILSANIEKIGNEIAIIDTNNNSYKIIDINKGYESSYARFWERAYIIYNNKLYFSASDGIHGEELFFLDFNIQEVKMIADINKGALGSYPYLSRFFDEKIYFTAQDEIHGREFRVIEQDQIKTLQEIYPGPSSSYPSDIVILNETILIFAQDENYNQKIWKIDTVLNSLDVK